MCADTIDNNSNTVPEMIPIDPQPSEYDEVDLFCYEDPVLVFRSNSPVRPIRKQKN